MLLSSPVKTCARVKNRFPEQLNDLYNARLFCPADGTTQKQGDQWIPIPERMTLLSQFYLMNQKQL